jgi:hypothetical protein
MDTLTAEGRSGAGFTTFGCERLLLVSSLRARIRGNKHKNGKGTSL